MRIAGYVPCSLSDYPGFIAAVVFTQGCNWRCPWCHNQGLIPALAASPLIPAADILQRLDQRRRQLDGVVVTGGEPTLQEGLPGFLSALRALGFKIKLDSNGSHPEVLESLLTAGLVDFVAIDLKAPWHRYDEAVGTRADVEALKASIALLRERGTPHHLRTTLWPGLREQDKREITAIAQGSPHLCQTYIPRTP